LKGRELPYRGRALSKKLWRKKMSAFKFAPIITIVLAVGGVGLAADHGHDQMNGMDMPTNHSETMPPRSALKPAQGANVKILSPKAGQVIKGDSVPLEFKMTKGKIGAHVHAYIDGQMAGMFSGNKGTLNGVKPGQHTLELRVATADHNTELNAIDKVTFTTK
jgi:hypothetical protein